ncbi:MAG: hypothetical protein B7X93_13120 [Hydrogenophilales bacterium 17-61-9]|nr:MAG: hypothetical protein B7X93_13120 [Hydrogenophilales bacterium 17-61-9]
MNVVCGIYGYQITCPIDLPGLRIEPRTSDHQQAERWARDLDSYQLTAILKATSISGDLLFNLEAVLSFVERLDVLISSPEEQTSEDSFAQFSPSITTHRRSNGGGAVIGEDAFFRSSRSLFISKALERLQDQRFCGETQFNILFFKCVETFRQRKPFVEVSYFLLYSGLESYARSVTEDRSINSSIPIYKLLTRPEYGFDVHQELKSSGDNRRAVATYTCLRNALFHNSKFMATGKDEKGAEVKLDMNDHLFNIWQLVALVILKAVEFDDGHINWNSWIDQQPFK